MHIDYLKSIYDLRGRMVADIGAGDGTYSRQLNEAGACVSGIEIDPAKVNAAAENLPDSISMLVGRAETLPLDSNSCDLACFFFSFHHVPIDLQQAALDEVMRILKPGGRLHVVEPFPDGSMFDVVRMVEDETHVRTHSHKTMGGLGQRAGFVPVARKEYTLTREYPDFETFVGKIVRSDPDHLAIFPTVEHEMKETFYRVLDDTEGNPVLHQPCAAYHFEVSG